MPEIKYQKPRPIKEDRASAGALAIPATGYVLNQLIGSAALPTLSGTSLAATLPIAGVLAGPTYGLYQTLTGQHTQGTQLTPEQVMSKAYVNDATFVARPRFLDLEESTDSENAATEENATEANEANEANNTNASSQNQEPEGKKSWRQKLADRIAGKPKPKDPKNSTNSEEQTSFNKALKVAKKVLIETKGNNFGPNYQWRNAARIPLYYKLGPYAIGYGLETIPEGLKSMGKSFEEGRQAGSKQKSNPDTVQTVKQVQTEPVIQYTAPKPITRYTQQQIDSINSIYDNYLD